MYYLLVRNLGVTRCIHSNEEDIYREGMSFACTEAREFPGGKRIREVTIRCVENPDTEIRASVFQG